MARRRGHRLQVLVNMTSCDTPHISVKACSGKCKESCVKSQVTWVIAACGGVVSLFVKMDSERLDLLQQEAADISFSLEQFRNFMLSALLEGRFNQLILVGSQNDIAWIHAALGDSVMSRVIAEIQYPLMQGWFRGEQGLPHLTKSLEQVIYA